MRSRRLARFNHQGRERVNTQRNLYGLSHWSWSCPHLTDTLLFLQKESKVSKPHTPKPPYSAQFREQMIELVRAGRAPSELVKEFGCHATSIHNWLRQADELRKRPANPSTQWQKILSMSRGLLKQEQDFA
jgi:transposase-like protein